MSPKGLQGPGSPSLRGSGGQAFANCCLRGDLGPELVSGQPGWGWWVDPDWCLTSSADEAPKSIAGEGPPAAEKEPGPPDPKKGPELPDGKKEPGPSNPKEETGPPDAKKEPGPPDPKKETSPPTLKEDARADALKKGDDALAQPSAGSGGPEGEGDLGGGPAEGDAGQPADLPQQTVKAEASVKNPSAKQETSGSQGPGEPKVHKKAAEGQVGARRSSPAFLHSPSCPAIISR